ncbi:hypothetical protein ACHAXT_002381 [Thalassiosira profunda]
MSENPIEVADPFACEAAVNLPLIGHILSSPTLADNHDLSFCPRPKMAVKHDEQQRKPKNSGVSRRTGNVLSRRALHSLLAMSHKKALDAIDTTSQSTASLFCATPTTRTMGNALQTNWSDTAKTLYGFQYASSIAFSIGIGTVLTNLVVSEWILKSRTKGDRDAPLLFVVPLLFLFWALWALIFNFQLLEDSGGAASVGYYVATPAIAFGGFALNLLLACFRQAVRNRKVRYDANEVGLSRSQTEAYVSPLIVDEKVDGMDPAQDIETPVPADELPAQPVKKATVEYINNIKIFLTNVVILHHCAANFADWPGLQNMSETPGWGNYILLLFTSVNASYFMNLFFFLSGFFVPKSFDKKGLYGFLFDRVKRLGIPFVVYTYFIGPYVYQGFMKLFFQVPFPGSTTNTGPTWFLNQLLMFNVVYAFLCGKGWSPTIKCPSLLSFFGISLAVGLLTGILLLFLPVGDFFFAVPQFWADFLSYPIYFFAGAVAQRNDWMESIKEKSRVAIYLWTIVSIILLAVYYFLLMEKAPAALTSMVVGVLHKGILSVGVCLAVTVFFMDHGDKRYRCTPFFSKAMYTAYVIQFAFPILAGLKCLFLILDATGNVEYTDSMAYITNNNLVFPGWLLVSAISTIIVWPLAYAIRSIPGFSQVL